MIFERKFKWCSLIMSRMLLKPTDILGGLKGLVVALLPRLLSCVFRARGPVRLLFPFFRDSYLTLLAQTYL